MKSLKAKGIATVLMVLLLVFGSFFVTGGFMLTANADESVTRVSVKQFDRLQVEDPIGGLHMVAVIRLYTLNNMSVTGIDEREDVANTILFNGTPIGELDWDVQIHFLGDGLVFYSRTLFEEGGSIELLRDMPLPTSQDASAPITLCLDEGFRIVMRDGQWQNEPVAAQPGANTAVEAINAGNLGGTDLYVEFDNGYTTNGMFVQRLAAIQYYVYYKNSTHPEQSGYFGDLNGTAVVDGPRYQMHQRRNALYFHAPGDALFAPGDEITLKAGMGFANVTEDASSNDPADPRHPWTVTGDRLGADTTFILNEQGQWVKKLVLQEIVAESEIEMLVGYSRPLNVSVRPEEIVVNSISYSSQDTAVATVNAEGVVTGKGVGNTQILITVHTQSGDYTKSVQVSVSDAVESIEIQKGETFREEYAYGEALDLEGLSILVKMASGAQNAVSVTADMINGYDANRIGQQDLIVSYQGKSAVVSVSVYDVIRSVEIQADKTFQDEYTVGDTLNLEGLSILVKMASGAQNLVPVTADMVAGYDSSKPGTVTLTVNYEGQSASISVTVKEEQKQEDPPQENPPQEQSGCGGAMLGGSMSIALAGVALSCLAILKKRRNVQ